MLSVIAAAFLAFVSTNIDDILVDTIIFTAATSRSQRLSTAAGKLTGVLLITAASILGGMGIRAIDVRFVRLLGFIPLGLGIKQLIDFFIKHKEDIDDDFVLPAFNGRGLFLMSLVSTVADGGDNIAVYLPLFASCTAAETAVTVLVFVILTALLCLCAGKLASLPALHRAIDKYRPYTLPAVFMLLGIYILFGV